MFKRILHSLLPALCSAPCILLGCLIMRMGDVPASIYGQNLAAWGVFAILSFLYLLFVPSRTKRQPLPALAASAALICATFLFPGTDGVHRWVRLGPLSLNAAFLCVPVFLLGLDALLEQDKPLPAALASVFLGILLFLQPDASMLAAFTLALVAMLAFSPKTDAPMKGACIVLLLLTVASWLRLDALEPVWYVEQILPRARALGLGMVSAVSLAVSFLPFGTDFRSLRTCSAASAVCLAALLLSSRLGCFPVPLIGYGISPILGYFVLATHVTKRSMNNAA